MAGNFSRLRRLRAAVVAVGLVAAATGCGWVASEESDVSVEILAPSAGDFVDVPFEVIVEASEPLGASFLDLHHLHIWFGGDEDSYLVVESDRIEIDNAPNGEHEMHVSLRHADHSPAGAEATVSLIISGGIDRPVG